MLLQVSEHVATLHLRRDYQLFFEDWFAGDFALGQLSISCQHQGHSLSQIGASFCERSPLGVGSRQLLHVSGPPIAVLFEDGRKN